MTHFRLFYPCLLILLLAGEVIYGQPMPPHRGVPLIRHYVRDDFQSDMQFWSMCEDREGVLYFGNNEGVLSYDGAHWQEVKLPNHSSVRSLSTDNSGVVYVGGFNALGRIRRDAYGVYQYESMLEGLRPEDRNVENIWQIVTLGPSIIFRGSHMLVVVHGDKVLTLPATYPLRQAFVCDKQLYVCDDRGIQQVDPATGASSVVVSHTQYDAQPVAAMLPDETADAFLLLTQQGALYRIHRQQHRAERLKNIFRSSHDQEVLCALRTRRGQYFAGTLGNQAVSFDPTSDTPSRLLPPLQDNTVLNLYETREGNLWALLNKGLDCIDLASPMTVVFDQAAVFDVYEQAGTLWLATNQGVMRSTGADGFRAVPGLAGQAWSFYRAGETLLCSHDRGLYVLGPKDSYAIPGIRGVWKVVPVPGHADTWLACTYHGLYVIQQQHGRWEVRHQVQGFDESTRDILADTIPGRFWICHGYKGVFRINLNNTLTRVNSREHFTTTQGLPSPYNINVFRWSGETVFTTNAGIYRFDETRQRFVLHPVLSRRLGMDKNVRRLWQYGSRTWFIHDDEAGYMMTADNNSPLEKDMFLPLKGMFNQSMECILADGHTVLMGTNDGLYQFQLPSTTVTPAPAPLRLVSVLAQVRDTTVSLPLTSAGGDIAVAGHPMVTRLELKLSVPSFRAREQVRYRYRLDQCAWSEWDPTALVTLHDLRPGDYTLTLEARSRLGEQAVQQVYTFTVLPVWYQHPVAYALYALLTLAVVVLMLYGMQRRIRRERERILKAEAEKRRVLELELHQIRLRQEKEAIIQDKTRLEEDVIHKSKELANYTMVLVKERELLTGLQDDLKAVREASSQEPVRHRLRELIRRIETSLRSEEQVQVFEANFERVHHQFFRQLRATFPDLTAKELQLCALVRMNLTNKEIATIQHISVRGVETARYRLRKRLGMTHEQDMAMFLDKLHQPDTLPAGSAEASARRQQKFENQDRIPA